MKKRYLKTPKEVVALKDTDTKIYAESIHGYYKFVSGVWCSFDDDCPDSWSLCPLTCKGENLYILEEEPVQQEATIKDIGKLCKFWYEDTTKGQEAVGVLLKIVNGECPFENDEAYYPYCRPLTKEEIKEFMERAE